MNREQALAAGAVGVVAVALLVAAVVPDAVADPTDDRVTRPGPVDVTDVSIAPKTVSGQTATLTVETRLSHRGNPTPNVSVMVRAIDSESGMLETTQTVSVGTLTEDREIPVTANLTVEREGGYRIEVVVYQDGERVETAGRKVSNLQALTPQYARTGVHFTNSEVVPAISVAVENANQNRTTLAVAASLTNRANNASGDLQVTIVLRQADSNLVAARETVDVGRIRAGRTSRVEATVTVPSEYNYYVDAILWKNGVMVDTARSVVNLDPQERIHANVTTRDVELQVSDFERTPEEKPEPRGTAAAGGTRSAGPGLGVPVAVIALLASVLFLRRWHDA